VQSKRHKYTRKLEIALAMSVKIPRFPVISQKLDNVDNANVWHSVHGLGFLWVFSFYLYGQIDRTHRVIHARCTPEGRD
jgi:hypothetical protein